VGEQEPKYCDFKLFLIIIYYLKTVQNMITVSVFPGGCYQLLEYNDRKYSLLN